MMKYLILYLLAINKIALVLCFADKRRATEKTRRISEKTFFAISLVGGSAGVYIAMYLARHKTNKLHFVIGIPTILVIQATVLLYVICTYC